jgi:hypothetical protein
MVAKYDYRSPSKMSITATKQAAQASPSEKLFWTVEDVMRELDLSKPTAYKLMDQSGCLAPINRRKRVSKARFVSYLEGGQHEADAPTKR